MADGKLRTVPHADKANATRGVDLDVHVDDSDLDMLEQGTLRVLRVMAKQKLDTTEGIYCELEVDGDSFPIVDLAIDRKSGTSALVTVR